MIALLIFSVALIAAILLSELSDRSVLSTAVLFLFAGFLVGPTVLNLIPGDPQLPMVRLVAEIALCSVLFSDGMRAGIRDIAAAWRLPGRALLLGLPLTLLAIALFAHVFAGLPWIVALLVGAILCPTDPVFASAIVGREEVPRQLRRLLNVESGINDGLALPIVLALLGTMGHESLSLIQLGGELLWGVALGVIVPWAACRLEQSRFFGVAKPSQPLFALGIGLLVIALAALTHGNIFLAIFAAGVTIASARPDLRDKFREFGELLAELAKFAALLVFGALITPKYFTNIHVGGYIFAILALVLARPAALLLSLLGSSLDWRERFAAAWFGPKGFASVIYGLLLFRAGVPNAEHLFHLIAVVITASMIAHASTDVLVARWFAAAAKAQTDDELSRSTQQG